LEQPTAMRLTVSQAREWQAETDFEKKFLSLDTWHPGLKMAPEMGYTATFMRKDSKWFWIAGYIMGRSCY